MRRIPEPERCDADHRPLDVDDGAAPPGLDGRGHDEGAIQHVLPEAREASYALHLTRRPGEVVVLVDAHRARQGAGLHVGRLPERRRRPRPFPVQLDDPEAGLEIEGNEPRRHRAAPAHLRLDVVGVEERVADADRVAACVEHDGGGEALSAQSRAGHRFLGRSDAQREQGGLDAADVRRELGDVPRREPGLRRPSDGKGETGQRDGEGERDEEPSPHADLRDLQD